MQRLSGPIRSRSTKHLQSKKKGSIIMLKKRLMSMFLALTMVVGLGNETFAAQSTQEGYYTEEEVTLIIQDGKAIPIDEAVALLSNDSSSISLKIATIDTETETQREITSDNWDSICGEDEQLAIADYILTNYLNYSEEDLQDLDSEMRIDIGFGPITSTHSYMVELDEDTKLQLSEKSYAQIPNLMADEDSGAKNEFSYYLNVTSKTASQATISYKVEADGYLRNAGFAQFISICAQNVAAVSTSAKLSGSYNLNGVKKTISKTNKDDGFDALNEGSGTGIRFDFSIPAADMSSTFTSNLSMTASVKFENSSVTSGGSFNVYGNFGTVTAGIAMPSFSYPWGVSTSLTAVVTSYKLNLTTKFR